MQLKKFSVLGLSLAFLSGCMSNSTAPVFNTQPQVLKASVKVSRVEDQIDRKRMEKYLASLTGKLSVNNEGIIPERGTVEGRRLTRAFLANTLENLGYKVEQHNYRNNGINILAELKADEPTSEYILVGAHMDSVRNAGADDNATGSSAVLEAATVLRGITGRKVNIIFAWFDEEELGLIGSRYLAREYKKQGKKITTVHTIDMMGWDGDNDRTIEVARPDGILWDYYKMVNQTHNLGLKLDRTSTGSSDHVSFSENGFHSVCLSEEWTSRDTTPHYHRKTDTFETVNLDFLVAGTRLMVAAVGDLSLKVPAPKNIKLVPHNKFPARERHFHDHDSEH